MPPRAPPPPPDVEAYLARLPPAQRAALLKLRRTILAAAPRATERISYQIPAFEVDGRVVAWMAAFAKHCSFFGGVSGAQIALASGVPESRVSKGTIRFSAEEGLPAALVRAIVKARVASNRPATSVGKRYSAPRGRGGR